MSTSIHGTIEVSLDDLYQLHGLIGDLENSLLWPSTVDDAAVRRQLASDCERAMAVLTDFRNRIINALPAGTVP